MPDLRKLQSSKKNLDGSKNEFCSEQDTFLVKLIKKCKKIKKKVVNFCSFLHQFT